MALCRSLLMEVFYEFKLRVYCMIINSPYWHAKSYKMSGYYAEVRDERIRNRE